MCAWGARAALRRGTAWARLIAPESTTTKHCGQEGERPAQPFERPLLDVISHLATCVRVDQHVVFDVRVRQVSEPCAQSNEQVRQPCDPWEEEAVVWIAKACGWVGEGPAFLDQVTLEDARLRVIIGGRASSDVVTVAALVVAGVLSSPHRIDGVARWRPPDHLGDIV